MLFSYILNQLININNVSAYKISKDTGISDRLIGYWKNGQKQPSVDNLLKIATYFNVSCDYLLTGKDKSNSNESGAALYSILKSDEVDMVKGFRQLNEVGQKKVLDNLDDILEIDKYKAGASEEPAAARA